jgi:hypothetical protein
MHFGAGGTSVPPSSFPMESFDAFVVWTVLGFICTFLTLDIIERYIKRNP